MEIEFLNNSKVVYKIVMYNLVLKNEVIFIGEEKVLIFFVEMLIKEFLKWNM